jgi:hypothetical protein
MASCQSPRIGSCLGRCGKLSLKLKSRKSRRVGGPKPRRTSPSAGVPLALRRRYLQPKVHNRQTRSELDSQLGNLRHHRQTRAKPLRRRIHETIAQPSNTYVIHMHCWRLWISSICFYAACLAAILLLTSLDNIFFLESSLLDQRPPCDTLPSSFHRI